MNFPLSGEVEVDESYFDARRIRGKVTKHFRVDHSDNKFSNGRSHINGIESFWSFAKRRLQKFNGVHRENFNLHLKESEFRFNNRDKDMYEQLLKNLNQNMP